MKFLLVVLLALSIQTGWARKFSKCDLARELTRQGFSRGSLENWVCLIQHESEMNTEAVGKLNTDGSLDYGLFQINNKYWCGEGKKGGGCNINCKELLTDDIAVASKCAQFIFGNDGFHAWAAWTQHCQGTLPDLSDCDLYSNSDSAFSSQSMGFFGNIPVSRS